MFLKENLHNIVLKDKYSNHKFHYEAILKKFLFMGKKISCKDAKGSPLPFTSRTFTCWAWKSSWIIFFDQVYFQIKLIKVLQSCKLLDDYKQVFQQSFFILGNKAYKEVWFINNHSRAQDPYQLDNYMPMKRNATLKSQCTCLAITWK